MNKEYLSDVFSLSISHLLLFNILVLFKLINSVLFTTLCIFLEEQAHFQNFHSRPCLWRIFLQYLTERSLCQADDLGINHFINTYFTYTYFTMALFIFVHQIKKFFNGNSRGFLITLSDMFIFSLWSALSKIITQTIILVLIYDV
jgi:hypothetical protein